MACESNNIWLRTLALVFFVANFMQHCVNGEPRVPCLFIFGDSLSDCGNNNNLPTTAKSNYNPYGIDFPIGPTGRFTNGRTGIDFITQFLGFEKFIPPFANTSGADILKGVNYASGAAGIRVESGSNRGTVISLGSQITNHKVIVAKIVSRFGSLSKAQQYLNKCLYYVNIGSNDYINNYFMPQFYPTSSIYSPEQYAEVLIEQLSLHLMALHEVGARKTVLFGLGLIGCTPFSIYNYGTNGSCFEEENVAASFFDDNLKSLVDQLNNEYSADSKFIFINSTSQINSSGFTVADAPCCPSESSGDCIPDKTPCSNRSEYVFWDEFHTTEAWNALTALNSYNNSDPAQAYPMNIKNLADLELDQVELELEFTRQLSLAKDIM